MWDIAGKACGLPVYKMLGGPTRERIRGYASYGLPGKDDIVQEARDMLKTSDFSALKFAPEAPGYATKSPEAVHAECVERVRTVRRGLGPEIDIALDYHGRSFSPVEAVKLAKALEPYNIFFLEEPALTEDPDSLVEVKRKINIPVAAGERCVTRNCTKELITKRAVHIIQPDPTANGGLLETFKLAARADLEHIVVAPHNACSPVSTVVCAHLDASISNFLIQEVPIQMYFAEAAQDILIGIPRIENGYIELPGKPGWGIELNEEAVQKYPFQDHDRPVIINIDGSVGFN